MAIITFTTDFGLEDGYAGVMKGVVLGINPEASLVDISHQIGPGDVLEAMFVLESSVRYFPEGSIHVAVVDPGVGSGRRALVAQADGHYFVGPDNGIFTPFLTGAREKTRKIISVEGGKSFYPPAKGKGKEKERKRFPRQGETGFEGSTFDGRDIFAPAAAWLSKGVRAEEFGPGIKDPVTLSLREPVLKGSRISGPRISGIVLHVDRFGNCITNIGAQQLLHLGKEKSDIRVKAKGKTFGIADFYLQPLGGGKKANTPHAIVNSSGRLEIFVPEGNASRKLGLDVEGKVEVF